MNILTVIGTRPEAIKMAPVIRALRGRPGIQTVTCATGQHREMLDQVLDLFDIAPDYDLGLMTPRQTLSDVTARVLHGVERVIREVGPDRILVQGDTTTAMAASLAAFYNRVPVGHVEAGLRSGDVHRPWPEEVNRRIADQISDLLFAPTQGAKAALEREGFGDRRILVTGNTVIDALLETVHRIKTNPETIRQMIRRFGFLNPARRLLLVTSHRREAFGKGIRHIAQAIAVLARRSDIEVVYPVHPNENVRRPVTEILGHVPSVHLLDPLEYVPFCHLMSRAHIILTDSGGVQEEAPALGKPVLVLRDVTERPEGVAAGVAELVGTNVDRIVQSAVRLLDDHAAYEAMSRCQNPYGDGQAARRICEAIADTAPRTRAADESRIVEERELLLDSL